MTENTPLLKALPRAPILREVGLRDGLQIIARTSLADTVGYADPAMVSRLFEQALRVAGDRFDKKLATWLHGSLWRAGLPKALRSEEVAA